MSNQEPSPESPNSDSDSDSNEQNSAPIRGVRWRFPIAIALIAAIAQAGVFAAADDDLSVINGLSMVIWILVGLVVAAWFLIFSGAQRSARLVAAGLMILAPVTLLSLFRMDGQTGDFVPRFVFRFAPSAEDRAADYFGSEFGGTLVDAAATDSQLQVTDDDWPRFGGANEDLIVRGVTIRKDWSDNPPRALWRHPVGPAWSSFAVVGNQAFTQEQRGQEEAVVCYDIESGEQRWVHTDPVRFEETASGVGPRATPTIFDSRLYALGATGILNCLNPITGAVLWTTNIVDDAETDLIMYGMSGSPLVHDDLVIVTPSGNGGAVAAYDRVTGQKRWSGGSHKQSYASPTIATIESVPQVLIYCDEGLCAHDITNGEMLWLFEWTNVTGLNLAQPIVLPDQSLFISSGYGSGSARLDITKEGDRWQVDSRWETPNRFKLKFNGGILRDGFLYGLDEGILSCIDLIDGQRQWKKGRYRYGQMLMVGDQLLILTEQGQVVLVDVTPSEANEIAKFQAIEGKTWNHPVLNRGRLLVRNGREAACYDLRPD